MSTETLIDPQVVEGLSDIPPSSAVNGRRERLLQVVRQMDERALQNPDITEEDLRLMGDIARANFKDKVSGPKIAQIQAELARRVQEQVSPVATVAVETPTLSVDQGNGHHGQEIPTIPVPDKTYGDTDVVPGMEKYAARLSRQEAKAADEFSIGAGKPTAQEETPKPAVESPAAPSEGPSSSIPETVLPPVAEAATAEESKTMAELEALSSKYENPGSIKYRELKHLTIEEVVYLLSFKKTQFDGLDAEQSQSPIAKNGARDLEYLAKEYRMRITGRRKPKSAATPPGEPSADAASAEIPPAPPTTEPTPVPLTPEVPPAVIPPETPPVEPPPTVPPVETPPVEPSPEQYGPSTLELTRGDYADKLRRRAHIIWRRSNKQELEAAHDAYFEALSAESLKKLEAIQAEFGDLANATPEIQAEANARIAEFLVWRANEGQQFRDTMIETGKKSGYDRFKAWWSKNTKARMIITGSLWGISIASLLTGFVPGAVAAQIARTAMMTGGNTIGAEATFDLIGQQVGQLKEITPEQAKDMPLEELQRYLAGETLMNVQQNDEFGGRTVGMIDQGAKIGVGKFKVGLGGLAKGWLKRRQNETGKIVRAIYEQRLMDENQERVKNMVAAGKTLDQIIEMVNDEAMHESSLLHGEYLHRSYVNRRNAIVKHSMAAIVGGLTAAAGFSRLQHMGETQSGTGSEKPIDVREEIDKANNRGPWKPWWEQSGHPTAPEQTVAPAAAHEMAGPPTPENVSQFVEAVRPGDSVWKIIERNLHEHFTGYDGLDQADKDAVVSRLLNSWQKAHGYHDMIRPGEHIDLTDTFSNTDKVKELIGHPIDAITANTPPEVASAIKQHILDNRHFLEQWVQNNPHEFLTTPKVATLLNPGYMVDAATAAGQEAAVHVPTLQEALVSQASDLFAQQHNVELAPMYPEQYAQFHATYPDQFPAVADSVHEVAMNTLNPLTVSEDGLKALRQFHETAADLYNNAPEQSADSMMTLLRGIKVGNAMRKGFIEQFINQPEVGVADPDIKEGIAGSFEGNIRKLLENIPPAELDPKATVGDILKRAER